MSGLSRFALTSFFVILSVLASGLIATTSAQAVPSTPGSVQFDGSGVSSYATSNNYYLSGDYTVELWIKFPVALFNDNVILSRWKTGSQEYLLQRTGDGKLTWFQKTTTGQVTVPITVPSNTTWHHIAAVRSGNTITLYVDGVSAGSSAFSGTVTSAGSSPLEIGGLSSASGGTATQRFEGRIANVRISQSALYNGTFTPGVASTVADGTTTFMANYLTDPVADALKDSITGLAPTVTGLAESHIDSPFPSTSPATPAMVQGTSNRGNSSYITWTASPTVAGQGTNSYTVYGSTDGSSFSPMSGCIAVATNSCTATGLTLARGYVFKATATNNAGTSDYSLVTASNNYMLGNGNNPCVDINVLGTRACGLMSNSQPYTTSVMPTPIWCTNLDGVQWINDELGVFDADGTMYFVHGNTIRKIAPAGFTSSPNCTSTLFNNSALLKTPSGRSIGRDAAGNLYVSNNEAADKSVIKISADGSLATTFLTTAETGGMVDGITFDSDQNLVGFINYGQANAAVVKFMNGTRQKRTFLYLGNATIPDFGGNKSITGISLNAFDDVTVSFGGGVGDVLVRFDAAFDQGTPPANCPYNCSTAYYNQIKQWNVFDPAGTFYPSKYPTTFHALAQFQPYTWAQAAVVDSEGNTWIGQELHKRIVKLDPQGQVVLSAGTDVPFLAGPSFTEGAKIDPAGNIWVRIGNANTGWVKYVGATKPFLRQLSYKGLGSTPYGSAKSDQIQLDGASGSVAFKTTNSGSFTVSGSGSITSTNNLEPGKYVVSGTALDSTNTSGVWTYALTVTKALPTIAVSSTPSRSVYQDTVVLTATPSSFDSGTLLTFKNGMDTIGTCTVTTVSCSIEISAFTPGDKSITAVSAESTHYLSATSAVLTHTVDLHASSVAFLVSAQPTSGETVTFNATVSPSAAGGTVSFKRGATVLCSTSALVSGMGSCGWANPSQGSYSVVAEYSGDTNYAPSTSSATAVNVSSVFSLTYSNATVTSPVSYRTGTNGITLPLPTRQGFIFNGWYDSLNGGALVGNAGFAYSPQASTTVYAHWTQASLSGINSADLTLLGTITTSTMVDSTLTASSAGSSVSVSIPHDALPNQTAVNVYLVGSFDHARSLITDSTSYLVSLVVSWVAQDGTVPATATGKPVTVVITNPSITAGSAVYGLVSGQVTLLGRAVADGTVTVQLTEDPEVVVANTSPGAPRNVQATSGQDARSKISWNAPSVAGGSVITSYRVTSNTGQICVTSSLTCEITQLSNGVSHTFTVVAINTIGESAPSAQATATPVGNSSLAYTGSVFVNVLGLGMLLIALGVAIRFSRRKRSSARDGRSLGE